MVRAAEVEVLITAELDDIEAADRKVKEIGDRITNTPAEKKIKADPRDVLASMDRVEDAAKKLVSKHTALKLDADISRAEKGTDRLRSRLEELEVKALGGLDVSADVKRAETQLAKLERNLDGLRQAKTMIEVDADPSFVGRLRTLFSKAESDSKDSGEKVGSSFGKSLDGATRGVGQKVGDAVGGDIEGSLVAALTAIPVAGGVILGAVAIGKAISSGIQDGLQQEVGRDRLEALTGIDEATALRLSRIAGEAYTRGFGESIEKNMDTARLALQFDIIDGDATNVESQKVISGLAGISDALGEDVRPIATAVTTLLRTGLATSAQGAFDILAAGAREGLNRSEDLLDTFTEYPVVLRKLGLDGKDALDLINQGLEAGARNSDIVADALKEFQIEATSGSEKAAAGFETLGLNAEEMTAKIAAGGQGAREGLDQVLQRLRDTEDPVARNAAAVALFNTKAEDLGDALFALDLDSTASKFDTLQGSAQRMFDTLADNDASKIQSAQRNIEVAADGIKGALASAFSEPLGDFADYVAQNRGPVLQFLSDLANSAFDFGVSFVEASATGTEALGDLVSGPMASAIESAGRLAFALGQYETSGELLALAEDMKGFDDTASDAADTLREKLIPPLEDMRGKLNGVLDGEIAMGYLNDASLRLADSIGQVGVNAEGATVGLESVDLANIRASESGLALEAQVRAAIAALGDQVDAAAATGEGQEALAARYREGTDALSAQLQQMGLTEEQARALIDTVLQTPTSAVTMFGSNARDEQGKVQDLANRIVTLPNGNVVVYANTAPAREGFQRFVNEISGKTIDIGIYGETYVNGKPRGYMHDGGIVELMAAGGLRGTTPMQPIAQMVPPNTWRVVGDRMDVPEAYIPLDGSARSMAILAETMHRMGVVPMAAGGVLDTGRASSGRASVEVTIGTLVPPADVSPRRYGRELGAALNEKLAGLGLG